LSKNIGDGDSLSSQHQRRTLPPGSIEESMVMLCVCKCVCLLDDNDKGHGIDCDIFGSLQDRKRVIDALISSIYLLILIKRAFLYFLQLPNTPIGKLSSTGNDLIAK
jgi:hypothetical protein